MTIVQILPPELKALPRKEAPALDKTILRRAFGFWLDITSQEQWPQIRDISYCQSGFNGKNLASRGVALIIRMGQGIWLDAEFWDNYNSARDSGVSFGIYWFLQPNMAFGPQLEAFLSIYNSLPWKPSVIALDVEDINTGSAVILPPSVAYNTNNVLGWLQGVESATGIIPGVYTRKNYWEQWTYRMDIWKHFWLWVASWTTYSIYIAMPVDWPTWKIWQSQGGTGRDPDIPGPVDIDNFHGTQAEQNDFFGGKNMPTEPFEKYTVMLDKSKCVALTVQSSPGANNPLYWYTAAHEDRITILEESVNRWGKVEYTKGNFGWISLFYTIKVETPPLLTAPIAVCVKEIIAWSRTISPSYNGPDLEE